MFTAAANDLVQVTLTDVGSGAFVPAVVVYGPSGALVTSHYANDVAQVSFRVSTPGGYTVVLHDWSSGAAASGAYTLLFEVAQ